MNSLSEQIENSNYTIRKFLTKKLNHQQAEMHFRNIYGRNKHFNRDWEKKIVLFKYFYHYH